MADSTGTKLTGKELRQEVQAAESAARQLLCVVEAWPAFVGACIGPLRAEKGADLSAAVVLRCATRAVSTLAVVCHNSKAASTAERFKPLLPRLVLVPRDELRAAATGWANADDLGEALDRAPAGCARSALLVVAVEVGGADGAPPAVILAHTACVRADVDGDAAERGPWRYCLDSGASFALSQPRCARRNNTRRGRGVGKGPCGCANRAQRASAHTLRVLIGWPPAPRRAAPLAAPRSYNWTGALRPGRVSPRRALPPACEPNVPDYAADGDPRFESRHAFQITPPALDAAGAAKARRAARLGREILDLAHAAVRVGVTTDEIDRVVHEATVAAGAYPAPLNYRQFPKSVCTSVNGAALRGSGSGSGWPYRLGLALALTLGTRWRPQNPLRDGHPTLSSC